MGYWVITSTIIILSLSQVLISSNIATMGADLAKIQKTTVVFEESNSVLGAKLDRYHSLLNVSENGSINGFIETTSKIVFGSTKVPVALR
ncbi:MAG: hypothetical protein UW73_C0002G0057 [Microgenomates group bacterium GW2011_GWB1_44_8]|uniref:Uncharacterized protein n=1 Tax=Candidatus Woesebacteria bacterium GW2011_GWA1_43_12 TaxID=1618557 RepID=A0A0G1F5X0_9BACT|nr:MAG: hypothetical protein UV66_C0002G0058 [Candidatus Woesebacteria bacterium GW2011_GWA1_43_12]KKT78526.1 MAG: hypothetical protein UW73_C0002G0057 [Microgenomates group bacterium GW2011_GWB1_44_8]